MALDETKLVRAGNLDEAAELIGGDPDITTPNTFKETAITNVDQRIIDFMAGLEASWPPDWATAEPLFTSLQSELQTILDTDIPDNSTTSLVDACAAIKAALIAYETTNGLTNPCPQCGSSSFITDPITGKHEFCPLSNGYTQTDVPYKAVTSSITYEPV